MDYDDNDFQSQNRHLAGEGSNRFPPALRSFAIPKFDFDESLHGAVRFDSLVETEVFLGIESNEDNQWIEDFSRGHCGIHFNSGEVESCSISRCNNVWLEATSSESVEMLLKSVGQEETVPVQTDSKESDACDELGCMIKPMDPNLKQNNGSLLRMDDLAASGLQPTLPPVNVPDNVCLLDDVEGLQPQVDTGPLVTQVEEGCLTVGEGGSIKDGIPKCVNQREAGNLISGSLDDRKEKTSPRMHADSIVCSLQNTTVGSDVLNNEDDINSVGWTSDQKIEVLETNKDKHKEEQYASSQEFQKDDQVSDDNLLENNASHLEETISIDKNLSNVERTSCTMAKGESGLSDELEIRDPSGINMKLMGTEGNSLSERHDVQDSSGSSMDNKNLVSDVGPSPLLTEENEASKLKFESSSKGCFGSISSLTVVSSSAEPFGEMHVEDDISCSTLAKSMGSFERGVDSEHHQELSVEEKESTALCPENSNTASDVALIMDRGVQTLSSDGGGAENTLIDSQLQSDGAGGNEADAVVDHTEVEMSHRPLVSLAHKERDNDAMVSPEASILDLKTSTQLRSASEPASEYEEDAARQIVCESADQPLLMPDGGKTESRGEGQTTVNSKDSQESTKEMRVLPVFSDLTTNKRDAVTSLEKDIDQKESSKVLELTVSNDEMPGSGPLTVEESGQSTNQKDQVENEAVTVSGDTNRQIAIPGINQLTVNNNEMPGSGSLMMEESGQGTNKKDQVENEAVTVSGDTNRQIAVPSTNQCGGSGAVQDGPASVSLTVIRTTELSQNENNKEGVKALSEITDDDAGKVLSAAGNPKLGDSSRDDRSFTFDISPMADTSQNEPGKTWNPVFAAQSSILSPTVDGSPSTSGLGQLETKVAQELSHGSQKVSDGAIASSGSNSNTERKSRRSSGKATVKASSKKGNPVKETASVRLERGGKMTNVSLSPPGIFQPVQLNEMQYFGHVNSGGVKPLVLAASTSSLPDLNFSASSSAIVQQSFTDLQQVQLRAQIFVYGALIQGTAPDEAYMISAYGGSNGGRSMWENAWRSCMERLHGQKSHLVTPEGHLLSGLRVPEQAAKQSALLSKEISPSIGQVSSKGIPTILNPVVPLSSPLWSLPMPSAGALQSSGLPRGPPMDYQHPLAPLSSHQTPPARSSVALNPSWISQAPFCGPWVASPQNSVLDSSGCFSVQLPTTETFQVTPVKESSLPDSSGVKHVLSGTGLRTGASSGVFTGISLGPDIQKVTEVSEQHSSVLKPRKKKKISVPESSGQNALLPRSHADVGFASAAGSHFSTRLSASVASSTPVTIVSKASTNKFISSLSAISGNIRKGDQKAEGRATSTEQTLTKVKEARVQAEDAAAFAASTVSHSQEIWGQLDEQRKSGLPVDIETKLASAAAAIAAAAVIAKVAAAAANVASNAALQAKLMADEAVLSSVYNIPGQSYSMSFSDGTHNSEKATPASILQSDDGTNNSSSILHAVREAARRRVEAASAASKHAENMDAIVKAAELAAEAVSQAGKIVAMGDRLPLNAIVAAAPECHPKVTQVTSELFSKSNDVGKENCNIDGAGGGLDISSRQDSLNKKQLHGTNFARSPRKDESCEDDMRLVDVISGSGVTSAKDAKVHKSRKASDLTKTVGVVPEPENELRPSSRPNEYGNAEESLKESNIKEASHVEVLKNGNGIKSAWFSANVLSVKDGKAYVAYDELTTGKGSEKLKEWVALSSDGDGAPKIRIARLVAAMPFEGTRKRRRAAMGNYTWSVGDRVDAWIRDSWWEGVITEKGEKDETMLTVHFPAQCETSVVRAWHLRSSLVWKDGEWIEWSSSSEHSHSSHVGDMPQEKRPRLQSPAVEAKGKDKMPKVVDAMESDKPDEPTLLQISADEKLFNIGKSTRDERKPDRLRMTRTGLQKEGSRVIFGVPKPGKKRKFMEVSKHYVADHSGKANEAKNAAKFAKYTMPQVPGTRGWKNTLQAESSEKRAMSKPRVAKSGKLQNVSGRSVPQKDKLSSAEVSAATEVANADNTSKTKDSVSHTEDILEKRKLMESQSFSSPDGGTDGPIVFSSLTLPSDSLSSKKLSNANAKAERISRGKLASAGRKLGKIEEDKVFSGDSARSTSDVMEPRRSNRKIQPTSRLLEGLQSSLMVSKVPSVSHDRAHKTRGDSRGNKHD